MASLIESFTQFKTSSSLQDFTDVHSHYVKGVGIRSYSGSYFPADYFRTEYGDIRNIQSKCGKIWIRIIPNKEFSNKELFWSHDIFCKLFFPMFFFRFASKLLSFVFNCFMDPFLIWRTLRSFIDHKKLSINSFWGSNIKSFLRITLF